MRRPAFAALVIAALTGGCVRDAPEIAFTTTEPAPSTVPGTLAAPTTAAPSTTLEPVDVAESLEALLDDWLAATTSGAGIDDLVCPVERQAAAALAVTVTGEDFATALGEAPDPAIAAFANYAAGDLSLFTGLTDPAPSYGALRDPDGYVLLVYESAQGDALFGALPCGDGSAWLIDPLPLYAVTDAEVFTRYTDALAGDPDAASPELLAALDSLLRAVGALANPAWYDRLIEERRAAVDELVAGATAWSDR